jgi:2-polyprenyl-3-methyl-5-hydroxy-6-metoxy-1,4-benzoquinol methylase
MFLLVAGVFINELNIPTEIGVIIMKKYYLAYEDRYKKVHSEGLTWFRREPTPELSQWVDYNKIQHDDEICEIGCGEGRDALHLSKNGYRITAIDASQAAISKCIQFANEKGLDVNFKVLDILSADMNHLNKFKWIYSIATLHMLVDENDRRGFLKALYDLLQPNGKLLLINMGDGQTERMTDTSTAFELQERNHDETGRKLMIAGTSFRSINWENHKAEIEEAGFFIQKMLNTENKEYGKCMTAYLERKN